MARLIGTGLGSIKQSGERRFAQRLQSHLEDDYLIWYDVPIGRERRYPDFIILHPRRGLLFIEVKDWAADTLKGITPTTCTLDTPSGRKIVPHPLEQVRGYAYRAIDDLVRNPQLRQGEGRYTGKLACPYGWGVVFTKISRAQVERGISEEQRERLLPDHLILYRDDIAETVDAETFQQHLWGMFNITFPHTLTLPQIDAIRWHLFPEIRIGDSGQASLFGDGAVEIGDTLPDLIRVMDIQQEQLARSLGEGHRVIHGVAGSGKTLILGFRCLHLAQALHKPILVLCFNITLAAKLRSFISERGAHDKVQVYHFHDWCGQQLKTYHVDVAEGAGDYFDRMTKSVIDGVDCNQIPRGQYGAVLIDEGHDFEPEWLRLITQIVDPETNSLLLLYDDAQSIYRKKSALKFSLASVGIQAQGRTTILKLNYRNTREILDFAYRLARDYLQGDDSGDIPLIQPEAAGASGPAPAVKHFANLDGEIAYAVRCLNGWHERGTVWSDMAVLYPGGSAGARMADALCEAGIPNILLKGPVNKKCYDPTLDQVAIMTIHSSKGLEFPTIVVIDSSFIPKAEAVSGDTSAVVRRLYVGITRAREKLLVSSHRDNVVATALNSASMATTIPEAANT